ncbi:hypothetical protein GCM10017607_31100 [Microbacterium thalassium]|nr:hypothetical protein GCM10017607_31100 [Microbacterium thalassium]
MQRRRGEPRTLGQFGGRELGLILGEAVEHAQHPVDDALAAGCVPRVPHAFTLPPRRRAVSAAASVSRFSSASDGVGDEKRDTVRSGMAQ